MTHAEPALPPMPVIGAALRKTTERIAREVAGPGPDATAPDWSEFEWRAAMAVAVMHGVSARLAQRSHWQGPELWQAFLAEQARQGLLRQQRVVELLTRIDEAARKAGLVALAMKGSALLERRLHRPGERPQSDVDLLVREADFDAAGRMIETLGFTPGLQVWKHQTFDPSAGSPHVAFGEHADNPIKIELHTRVMERLAARPTDSTEITSRVYPRTGHPGLNPYPSDSALMLHLLLHTSGNLRVQGVRMIQLLDIAGLAGRLDAADWTALLDEGAGPAGLWWMLPVLNLVERYFPHTIPATVLARLEPVCPPWLRRSSRRHLLSDMSLSKIEIPAFPGLAWVRSPAEGLLLVTRRLIPDRETRELARVHGINDASASEVQWTQHSYLGKMLRCLVSQRPRIPTIYSLRRALDYRPHLVISA